jgi:hypothetical protein
VHPERPKKPTAFRGEIGTETEGAAEGTEASAMRCAISFFELNDSAMYPSATVCERHPPAL